jgi:hypothetical protein
VVWSIPEPFHRLCCCGPGRRRAEAALWRAAKAERSVVRRWRFQDAPNRAKAACSVLILPFHGLIIRQTRLPTWMELEQSARRIRRLELLLVTSVAFAGPVYGSFYYFLGGAVPKPGMGHTYSLITELLGLSVLIYVLFRQGRHLSDIGFGFNWRDIPRSLALATTGYAAFYVCFLSVFYGCYVGLVPGVRALLQPLAQDHAGRIGAPALRSIRVVVPRSFRRELDLPQFSHLSNDIWFSPPPGRHHRGRHARDGARASARRGLVSERGFGILRARLCGAHAPAG